MTKMKKCPNAQGREYHIVRENGCVTCANYDEIGRFNERLAELRDAKTPLIYADENSLANGLEVVGMDRTFDLHLRNVRDSWLTSTSALANDDRWARLLKRAGVERHPMNAAFSAR